MNIIKKIGLVLFFLVLSINVYAEINLAKTAYDLGEVVNIGVSGIVEESEISILSLHSSEVYKFLGDTGDNIKFYPRYSGDYIVNIKTQDNYETKRFTVLDNTKETENTEKIIQLEKTGYVPGETVKITLLRSSPNYFIEIISPNNIYRYLGSNNQELMFIPKDSGKYEIRIVDKDNILLDSQLFNVIQEQTSQPEITGEESNIPIKQEIIDEIINDENPISKINPIIDKEKNKIKALSVDKSNFKIQNSKKNIVDSDIYLRSRTNNQDYKLGDTILTGRYDVKIIPKKNTVKKLELFNVNIDGEFNLGFEELDPKEIVIEEEPPVKVFSFNPENIEFSSGYISSVAMGTELWKCADWNFSTQECYGTWEKLQDIIPGEEYNIYVDSQDPGFAETGVATVNTKKPIYHPTETIEILMVVLDNQGYLVNEADITLIITAPNGSTYIKTTSSNEIVHQTKGTYRTFFNNTPFAGNYLLNIIATGPNTDSNLSSYFVVKDYYEFDIIRTIPITIDPWDGPFTSKVRIFSYNHTGQFSFTERLPINFELYNVTGATISNDSAYIYLRWQNLNNNDIVSYTANSPLITPDLYKLGPSFVEFSNQTFVEARPWYMAIDPIVTYDPDSDYSTNWDAGSGVTYREIDDGTTPDTGNHVADLANDNVISEFGFPAVTESGITSMTLYVYTETGSNAQYTFYLYQGATTSVCSQPVGTGTSQGWQSCTWNNPTGDFSDLRVRLGGVTKSGAGKNTRAYVYTAYLEVNFDNPPSVTLHEPNGGLYEVSSLDFNFTVTDDVDDPIPSCTLYANFSGTWEANESQNNVANGTKTSLTVSNLDDGGYVWNVQCTDSSSSAFAASNYSVTINANSPSIVGPELNESVVNQSHKVMFNVSITDSFGISHSYVNLRYPNGTTKSHTLSTNGDEHYFEIIDTYQIGYYNVTLIWANDTYNQISQISPETISFEVTASPPSIFDLLTPVTGTESQDTTPLVTWQETSDETFKNYSILFDKHSDMETPDYVYFNTLVTETSYTLDFALDGNSVYYWRVIAYDDFDNSRNSTSDFIYITDTTQPSIFLSEPENNTYITQNTITFNYTPTETNTLDDCILYGNFSGTFEKNETDYTPDNGVENFFTTNVFVDGEYRWNVWCNDSASNSGFTLSDYYFILDTTGPVIDIIKPANNTKEETTNNPFFTVNVSDFYSDVASCELIVNHVIQQTDNDITEGEAFNFTDFMFNGNYNWSVNCSDEHGFETTTGCYNISISVIDSDPPFITLNFPGDNDYLSYQTLIFNYTTEDATGIENCSLYIDGTLNQTNYSEEITNLDTNIFEVENIQAGVHNWQVKCFDNSTEYNLGSSDTYDFTIDLTDPTVSLDIPGNNEFVSSSSVDLFYTPSDTNLESCKLYGNFTGTFLPSNLNISPTTDVQTTFTKTLSDGKYKWNVWCNDSSGRNSFAVSNNTFKVDTSAPYYSNNLTNPLSPVTYSPGAVYEFNITWQDNFEVNKTWIAHNFTQVYENNTLTSPENNVYNFTFYSLAAGTYFYRFYANDTIDNLNQTPWYVYTINRDYSEIDLLLEGTEGYKEVDEDTIVNLTARLVQPTTGILELYLNGTLINDDSAPLENLTLITEPGLYNITAKYPQTQNYSYSNQTWYLNVTDITPPTIYLSYPENDSFVGTNDVIFTYNVSDDSPMHNCTLYVNDVYNQYDDTITKYTDQTFQDNLADGNYSYYIECFDTAGNSNTSQLFNFTVLKSDSIIFTVSTNLPKYEIGATANITSTTRDVFSSPMDTNITLDIIKGITTLNWWNHSWKKRMPIYLNETQAKSHDQAIALLNVTGLAGNITSCVNELRLVRNNSEDGYFTFEEIPFEVTAGDNNEYCTIKFKTNLTANALEENNYYVYYNNSDATNPNYDVLISGSYNYYAYEAAADTGTPGTVTNIVGNNDGTAATMSLSGGGAASESAHGRGFITGNTIDTITNVKVRYRYAVTAATGGTWAVRYSVDDGGLYSISYSGSSTVTKTTSNWDDITADYASLTWSELNRTRLQGYVDKPGGSGTITEELYWVEMNVSVDFEVNITETRTGNVEELVDYSNAESGVDGEWTYNFETFNQKYGNYSAIAYASKDLFTDALEHTHFEIIPDTTPPNITLHLPEDYWQQGVGNVNFTYYVSDYNLDECTLYYGKEGSFEPNETQTDPVNNQNNTIEEIYFGIGLYEWNINCTDIYNNSGFAESNFTLNITGPDLLIENNYIFFSTEKGVEGENITIFANITNIGLSDLLTNFTVQFYLDDPTYGSTQINGNISVPNLTIGETVTVNVSYVLGAGNNQIFVLADALNQSNESNEDNNKANNNITVELYHYYYGNVSAGIYLLGNESAQFYQLANNTQAQGHIIAADADSIFLFADLQALTRNTNDDSVNNDFTELDTTLGTSIYSDSIKEIWGDGTDIPILTRTFSLSTGAVTNVPIVNSTNTSNFVTGILWDTADDGGNLQYDTADNEDVVFITEMNIQQSGKYGKYDYEIKIPGFLDTYKGSEDKINLYVEIT